MNYKCAISSHGCLLPSGNWTVCELKNGPVTVDLPMKSGNVQQLCQISRGQARGYLFLCITMAFWKSIYNYGYINLGTGTPKWMFYDEKKTIEMDDLGVPP